MTAANWHPDPTGQHEYRYWDGTVWTEHVANQGVRSISPLPGAPEPTQAAAAEQVVEQQPVQHDPFAERSNPIDDQATAAEVEPAVVESTPAAEPVATEPEPVVEEPAAEPAAVEPESFAEPEPEPAPQAVTPPSAAQPAAAPASAGITGDLIGGRYAEANQGPVGLQDNRMLRVSVGQPFMARQGSMVAYQGGVTFAFQGGGMGRMLKKVVTGEGLQLMRVEGQGDVFLADTAKHVHILNLSSAALSVNGANVLAFSESLDWNVERVKGGSIAAGGLFNTTLRGTGWVAITTDGEPVVLDAGEAPTFADTQAVVAWSADLETGLQSSMSAGALIGRGSGEAIQVAFRGRGFVIVQPSEGYPVPTSS